MQQNGALLSSPGLLHRLSASRHVREHVIWHVKTTIDIAVTYMSSLYVHPPAPASNNSLYNCMQPELVAARHRARLLMYRYNTSPPTMDGQDRRDVLAELLNVPVGDLESVVVEPP